MNIILGQNGQNGNQSNFCVKYCMIIVLSIILFAFSILFLFLIANITGTNSEIGLYKRNSDDLLNIIVINLSINLINIFISILCFIFSILVKEAYIRIQRQNNNINIINNNNDNNVQCPELAPSKNENLEISRKKGCIDTFDKLKDNGLQSEKNEVITYPKENMN